MASALGAKLKEIRALHGMTQDDFCAALGEKPSKIRDIESGRQRINDEFLAKLVGRFAVDLNWLFDQTKSFPGRKVIVESPDKTRPGHGELVIQGKDYAWVRRMGLSISAGNGLEALEPEEEDGILLPTGWFSSRRLNADACVIVSVRGDSMAPSIPDGALALIDCTVKVVVNAGVYAFTLDGQAYVKRLIPSKDTSSKVPSAILMVSDSPAYAPVPLVGERMNALRIVGRVRAVLSEL